MKDFFCRDVMLASLYVAVAAAVVVGIIISPCSLWSFFLKMRWRVRGRECNDCTNNWLCGIVISSPFKKRKKIFVNEFLFSAQSTVETGDEDFVERFFFWVELVAVLNFKFFMRKYMLKGTWYFKYSLFLLHCTADISSRWTIPLSWAKHLYRYKRNIIHSEKIDLIETRVSLEICFCSAIISVTNLPIFFEDVDCRCIYF